MFGRISLLPPTVTSSFSLCVEETLVEMLMCNMNLGGVGFCALLAVQEFIPLLVSFLVWPHHNEHTWENTLVATELLLFYNIYPEGRKENSKISLRKPVDARMLEVRHTEPVLIKK